MSTQRNASPSGKDAVAIEEIGGLIMSRFPDAEIDIRPSSDEKGAWMLLVYLDDEDERYDALANLVYGRLAMLRSDDGVKIEMLSFDKALERAVKAYMQAHHMVHMLADGAVNVRAYRAAAAEVTAAERAVNDIRHATREAKRRAKRGGKTTRAS